MPLTRCRILLISAYFPPYSPIGGSRMPMLADYWRRQGHEVRVISVADVAVRGILRNPLEPDAVQHLPFDLPGAALRRLRGQRSKDQDGRDSTSLSTGITPRAQLGFLKRLYRQLMLFPDRYRNWIEPATQAGLALTAVWRPDIIYSSSPPESGHIVARNISRQTHIPWVAELRDLWDNNPYNNYIAAVDFAQGLLARRVLRGAAAIVTVTRFAARHVARSFTVPVMISYNGFAAQDFAESETGDDRITPEDPARLTIVHAGTIYAGRRDPSTLFAAMALLGPDRHQVRVKFYHDELASVAASARAMGVEECVDICAPVPRDEILKLERGADVLLLCRWNNPADDGIIPGKLFEYIGARRPILSIGSCTGEAADIIRAGAFGVVLQTPEDIAAQLRRWIALKQADGGRLADLPRGPTLDFVRDHQFDKIEGLIGRICAGETLQPAP